MPLRRAATTRPVSLSATVPCAKTLSRTPRNPPHVITKYRESNAVDFRERQQFAELSTRQFVGVT
jgi:hypothetical protein